MCSRCSKTVKSSLVEFLDFVVSNMEVREYKYEEPERQQKRGDQELQQGGGPQRRCWEPAPPGATVLSWLSRSWNPKVGSPIFELVWKLKEIVEICRQPGRKRGLARPTLRQPVINRTIILICSYEKIWQKYWFHPGEEDLARGESKLSVRVENYIRWASSRLHCHP